MARSSSNHKSRQKVKQIRDELKSYFKASAQLFTADEIEVAFGFRSDNKSYKCNSSKKLAALLACIETRSRDEERKNTN